MEGEKCIIMTREKYKHKRVLGNYMLGETPEFFFSTCFLCQSMSVNATTKLYYYSFSSHWPCDGKPPPAAVCH